MHLLTILDGSFRLLFRDPQGLLRHTRYAKVQSCGELFAWRFYACEKGSARLFGLA